jgi:hypothetical protein
MAVSVAAGYPTFSGVTIPVLYPTETLIKIYEKTVISNICSTDYEGDLKKKGDVARIRLKPTVTRRKGEVGKDMVPTVTTFSHVDLTIDKMYYFNEEVDDVIAQQSDVAILNELQDAMSQQDAVDTDADVLAGISTQANAENCGANAGVKTGIYDLGATGASIPITDINATDKLLDIFEVLHERNVTTDMWCVIPSWYARKLKSSELKQANEMGDGKSVLRTGLLGTIDGVELYQSNNMTSVTDGTDGNTCWYILAGHKSAVTFAKTISNVAVIRPDNRFAKLVQMQVVYGYEVVNDPYLASLYCRPGA